MHGFFRSHRSGVLFLLEPISPCYPRVTCMFYLSCACFVLEHFKLVRRWGSWCKRGPITMNDGWKLVRNIPLLGINVLFFWLIVRQSSLCAIGWWCAWTSLCFCVKSSSYFFLHALPLSVLFRRVFFNKKICMHLPFACACLLWYQTCS